MYKRYNFDEPWDGPNNRKLLDQMPAVYSYPAPTAPVEPDQHVVFRLHRRRHGAELGSHGRQPGDGRMAAPYGPRPLPDQPAQPPTITDITDGTSNTILVVEAKRDIPWTKPEDIPFDPNGPLPELGGFTPNGFNAAFADGSVRFIKKSINRITLKALITRAGDEVLNTDSF